MANLINEEYAGLLGGYVTSVVGNVKGLRSLVLYGSVARGRARKESDLDLLAIIDDRESLRNVFNEMIELTGKDAPSYAEDVFARCKKLRAKLRRQ
ncbi:MAG: nucleotidyltransferase domain-containing protein [Thaumarchaeota archaeon]|nr:nucleotidyltransferase domain-containing protein [Nitrososphaerota archaeon]